MPMDLQLNLPTSVPQLTPLTLDSWKKGVITLIDKSRVPKDALIEMQNLFLAEDGVPTIRPGTDWWGNAPSANAIDGAGLYETSAGVPHLVVVAGGIVYRSVDDGITWNTCTAGTFTSGQKVYMVQDHGYLYLTSGGAVDNIVRYDGTTTLQPYTALLTPGAPTPTESGSAVMTGTGYHHYYKISAVNTVGFTTASAATADVQAQLDRTQWTASTDFVTLAWAAVTGATRYDIYVSHDNIDYFYLDTVVGNASLSYRDDGTALENANILAPVANTTQGPRVTRLDQIGSRLWGVQDYDNPWRVWFSGSGSYSGYFSAAYDGGYIDIMNGSQFRPIRVVDYRDGKGTPYATVWCKSSDGRGCIWQITLEVLTVGDVSITVPSAFRLPGSRGTDAPESVVNVLNDYMFYNSQAFYNLGSRAQFLNLLSTDESSANIRPTVKQISTTGASKIASIYYDAKVFFSVPYGSTTNNYTIVYDTERKAWIPEAFTIGFERFFQYTQVASDGTKTPRLLAWKPGDTRLTQISSGISGDYGVAFQTSLVTGLYPVSRDRFEFMWVEDAEMEFSQPGGTIGVELIGIERSAGYASQKSTTVQAQTSNVGWSTGFWSAMPWTDTSVVPDTFSESSVKRYFRVLRELNAYQWRITTNSIDAAYLLRTLQLKGTITQGGKPRGWRIT